MKTEGEKLFKFRSLAGAICVPQRTSEIYSLLSLN